MHRKSYILFFTGASGAGKTSLLWALKKKIKKPNVSFIHFDSIDIPNTEDMVREFGSPSAWQEAKTHEWVDHLILNFKEKDMIFFEGQVNIDYIEAAFKQKNWHAYDVILVHCQNEERHNRLALSRDQPDLVNSEMDNWSSYLEAQAKQKKVLILDTTKMTDKESCAWVEEHLANIHCNYKIK
ncbi:MAG: AAA family ATPase [Gammaproteobacteria bacterium]|nr:AAA family ATPase [Gammaproteobacteria bacterium]